MRTVINDNFLSFIASEPEWSERSEAMEGFRQVFVKMPAYIPPKSFTTYLYFSTHIELFQNKLRLSRFLR